MMGMPSEIAPDIQTISSRTGYRAPHLHVLEDEVLFAGGHRGLYSYIDKPDFALVMPYENGGFRLVEQYRYPVRSRQWEFPQGGWPAGQPAGTADRLAVNELREEVGATAARWDHLGHQFASYGHSNQGYDVWLASGLTHGEPERELSEQDMRHDWFTEAELRRWISTGRIGDSHTVAAWALLELARPDLAAALGS